MRKIIKAFMLFILIILVAFLGGIGSQVNAVGNRNLLDGITPYQNEENIVRVYDSLSNYTKVYSFMKITANVYNNMLINSRVYKELLAGKYKENFGGGAFPEGINPKFYNSIPISGSLDVLEMSSYGPYTSCNWIYVSVQWTPKNSPLTVVIYDDTSLSPVASRSSTNNSISVWASVNESHSYSVFVFNDSSKDRVSYKGKIILSRK